jgi:hypothetical protein
MAPAADAGPRTGTVAPERPPDRGGHLEILRVNVPTASPGGDVCAFIIIVDLGGHRPRRVATDRHVGPDDGRSGAIWHSNVPGTSPISGGSEGGRGRGPLRKLRKGSKLEPR